MLNSQSLRSLYHTFTLQILQILDTLNNSEICVGLNFSKCYRPSLKRGNGKRKNENKIRTFCGKVTHFFITFQKGITFPQNFRFFSVFSFFRNPFSLFREGLKIYFIYGILENAVYNYQDCTSKKNILA